MTQIGRGLYSAVDVQWLMTMIAIYEVKVLQEILKMCFDNQMQLSEKQNPYSPFYWLNATFIITWPRTKKWLFGTHKLILHDLVLKTQSLSYIPTIIVSN